MLYNWDAVQFALALSEYDVGKHQPHPPGYLLYVVLGRLVDARLGDPAAAYVLLAVVFSGLTTFVVYFLARAIYDRATALAAAALLAVSPLFWFYGSVGLTYAGEALLASTVAYFAYRALQGSRTHAWLGAVYLGLAAGMRQSLLVLLFPLWLGTAVVGLRKPRVVVRGGVLLAAAVLTWFVPMIWLTGGLGRYVAATTELADALVRPTSIIAGRLGTTLTMTRHLVESVLVGLGPLVLAAFLVGWYVRRHGFGQREWFLLGWSLPPVAVYTLVHFGQPGYVLTFLPALVILLSRVLVTALWQAAGTLRHPRAPAALTATAVALVVLVNGAFFVSARPVPRDFDAPRSTWMQRAQDDAVDRILSRTAAALREHEDVVRTFVGAIRGLYAPDDTVVITEQGNPRTYTWFRHAMFYLPEYELYELQTGATAAGYRAARRLVTMAIVPETEIRLPARAKRLVWFVDHWHPRTPRPPGLDEVQLPYGRYLYVLPLEHRPTRYAGYTFLRDPPPSRRASRSAR